MSIRAAIESRLGLTRGDVTVTLFIALAAVAGFIYLKLFDSRSPDAEHREMLRLTMRHDSILAARRIAHDAAIARITAADDSLSSDSLSSSTSSLDSTAHADSTAQWRPLTAKETAVDEAIAKAERPSRSGNAKDLPSRPIDLNAASKADLMRLPGVGEKTALAIIERRGHLPFRRIEDIMEVKGIGEKKFEKMKPYITVR